VTLEVELAYPAPVALPVADPIEEPLRGLLYHGRQAVQVLLASQPLQMLHPWPAAAVADAEEQQAVGRDVLVLVLLRRLRQRPRRRGAVVGVLGQHMGEHSAAVDALPPECVVREVVDDAPRQFLSHEGFDARLTEDLRQRGRVPEDVGQPQVRDLLAELVPVEPLAVEQLAHQRLAARHVGVRLHPHGALDLPPALGVARLHLVVEARIVVLHPLIELGLARAEDVVGVPLHHPQRRSEGAGALSDRLTNRPQPGQIHVRVTDSADGERRIATLGRQQRREHPPSLGRYLLRRLRRHKYHLVQRRPDLMPSGRILGKLLHQLAEHLEVVVEGPDLRVAHGNRGLLDPAVLLKHPEEVIAAGIGPDFNDITGGDGTHQVQDTLARSPETVVIARGDAGEALPRVPLGVDDEHLTIDVEEQHDLPASSLRGHGAGEAEPGAVEETAPLVTRLQLQVLAGLPLLEGNRLLGDPRLDGQLAYRRVHRVPEAALNLAKGVAFLPAVVRHGAASSSCGGAATGP